MADARDIQLDGQCLDGLRALPGHIRWQSHDGVASGFAG